MHKNKNSGCEKMKGNTKKLFKFFSKKDKKMLLLLSCLVIVAAIFETVSIGLIVPFVEVITNPKSIVENKLLFYFYKLFNFQSFNLYTVILVGGFIGIFLLKNLYLLFFQYFQNKTILDQQVKLSQKLFREYLTKPYSFHLERNTASLHRNVNGEVSKIFQGIVMAGINLLTELLIITCVLILLIFTAPVATITAAVLLISSVAVFFKVFRKKISELGMEQRKVSAELIKWVNQGLGASKEVKVSGKETFFVNEYNKHSKIKAKNSLYMNMLDQLPRLFLETILVSVVLITMLIVIFQQTNTSQLVSTMALYAMAAFRLLPSINRVIAMVTAIKYNQPALLAIYEDLFLNKDKQSVEKNHQRNDLSFDGKVKAFKESITLNDVSFRYPNQKDFSIKDVSINIPIGKSVAFIGESGSGKTTIVDIILGLFETERGEVLIDGKKLCEKKMLWQQKIGYIPQSIFLSDDTIRNNIAFGIGSQHIDDKEVWRALEQAQLKSFVESLPDKLDTSVGEGGVRLSGGQRQRIGIARALYNNPEILFMDEATSALDGETEKEIMKAIDSLKGEKTLIIIAHRISTIRNCDLVFKVSSGRVKQISNRVTQQSS